MRVFVKVLLFIGMFSLVGDAENTVKNHIKNLLEKLGLENRVQLASYAVKYITK